MTEKCFKNIDIHLAFVIQSYISFVKGAIPFSCGAILRANYSVLTMIWEIIFDEKKNRFTPEDTKAKENPLAVVGTFLPSQAKKELWFLSQAALSTVAKVHMIFIHITHHVAHPCL